MGAITVFVADDSIFIREGVKAMLACHRDLEIVGEAEDHDGLADGAEAVAPTSWSATSVCLRTSIVRASRPASLSASVIPVRGSSSSVSTTIRLRDLVAVGRRRGTRTS
jgi:chemotaxis response regulator CheB